MSAISKDRCPYIKRRHREESHVKMEAETGAMSQGKESREPPDLEEARKDSSREPLQRTNPADILISGLLNCESKFFLF